MNKNDLISQVAKESKLTKTDANKAIDAVIAVITKTLKKGESVQLTGFGSFRTSNREASEGRNPRTGQKIRIPATRLAKFRAGKLLREAVVKR